MNGPTEEVTGKEDWITVPAAGSIVEATQAKYTYMLSGFNYKLPIARFIGRCFLITSDSYSKLRAWISFMAKQIQ